MRKPPIKLSELYSGRYGQKFPTTLNTRGTPFASKIMKVEIGEEIS
jgi:hypothetical protein